MPKKTTISIYISDELVQKIDTTAAAENRTRNNLIETRLKKSLQT